MRAGASNRRIGHRWARALGGAALTSTLCATAWAATVLSTQASSPVALHSAASGAPSATPAVLPRAAASTSALAGLPDLNVPWLSSNWSGYAVTGTGITSVDGTWTVPAVEASPSPAYSTTWVGIDGFSASDTALIQAGTEQDAPGRYYAWWSTSYAEQPIAEPVAPGDVMWAHIAQVAGSTWVISMGDTTRAWGFSTTVGYYGPGQSAEWIVEAPAVNGQVATLAQFSTVTFDLAAVDGADPLLLPIDAGIMHPSTATLPAAVPSLADLDTDGFSVAYGTVPPLPPAS